MFNPARAATCTGDDCYDKFVVDGPTNPIQAAIDLSGSTNYNLQKALLTEFHSYTNKEINDASYKSSDGTTATVNIDAIMKISARFGTGVALKTSKPQQGEISIVNPQGLEQVWLGAFDESIYQES
mgnify:FL=1